jgi:hypothetical protein
VFVGLDYPHEFLEKEARDALELVQQWTPWDSPIAFVNGRGLASVVWLFVQLFDVY